MATNECTTKLWSMKHCAHDIGIPGSYNRTKIYNGNKSAVQWAASMISKGINNLNFRGNIISRKSSVKRCGCQPHPWNHKYNQIITKEIKDNTHFRNIRDSVMVSLKAFLKYSRKAPLHIISDDKLLSYFSIRSEHIVTDILELKTGVSKHVVPTILEPQSVFRKTV